MRGAYHRSTRASAEARPDSAAPMTARVFPGALWMAALLLVPMGAGAQEEAPRQARPFSILDTRYARTRHDEAAAHIAAERWSDAIVILQKLIEDPQTRADVLALPEASADSQGRTSLFQVHAGAADRARRLLLALPPDARRLYAERFGAQADELLAEARASQDRKALVELARRYPLAPAARSAWWALGDLELEHGNRDAAVSAWARARALHAALEEPLPEGATRREELLAQAPAGQSINASVARPIAGAEPGTPPSVDGHSWRLRIDDNGTGNPFNVAAGGEGYNLLPVLAKDTLFLSNSMRVYAVDAWTGNVRWRSDEPPGWDLVDSQRLRRSDEGGVFRRQDFFEGIDRASVLIAPAVGGEVVVSALQIPVTHVGNLRYQNITITRVIPDRRLFAFDRESGRPLWNHMPPPGWDGEQGSFSDRMSVAGPPVVSGARVLVPCYRISGRIDYHVACYELATGRLLWSTGLISGQLPTNMFGRHQQEFAAAPLLVEGERVLALTQLGSIAALDLYTGDVLWETFYDQIPLPPNEHYVSQPRRQVWKNATPVLAEGVVVATPTDSTDMIGVDLSEGTLLWALPHSAIPERRWGDNQFLLVGAEPGRVYLSGPQVIVCRSSVGLAVQRPPLERSYSAPLAENIIDADRLPRPAMGAGTLVVATPARRVVLPTSDLRSADRLLSGAWGPLQGPGNALLAEGVLFTLSSKYLSGCFDWEMLARRYDRDLRERPDDPALALSSAHFLARRAASHLEGARLPAALDLSTRARALIERLLASEGSSQRFELELELFALLRLQAEIHVRSAASAEALPLLERASAHAPDRRALRDTLLEIAQLQQGRGEGERRLETLARLEERCADLPMPDSPAAGEISSTLIAEILPSFDAGTPVGQWVLEQRAAWWRGSGAATRELEELHRLLARHGDVLLWGGEELPRLRVTERISASLEEPGGREAYKPFEQLAELALQGALEGGDSKALQRVAEIFPHSRAAAAASGARIDQAFVSGDAELLARLVQERLPASFQPARANPEEATMLLRLAALLQARGNPAVMRGLLPRLAAAQPALAADLGTDDQRTGRPLSSLAAELPRPAPHVPTPVEGPDPTTMGSVQLAGDHAWLGSVSPADGAAPSTLVFVRRDGRREHLLALGPERPAEPLWSVPLERGSPLPLNASRCLLMPGRVVVISTRSQASVAQLVAHDAADGSVSWRWSSGPRGIESLCGSSGVLVATLSDESGRPWLAGIDAGSGVLLWEREVPLESADTPVCGEGKLVLLPASGRPNSSQQALVLDLFTGREGAAFELAATIGDADQRGAWIEGDVLVLPSFPRASPGLRGGGDVLSGWNLESGARAWSVPAQAGRDLDSVLRVGSDAYLIFLAGGAGKEAAGSIHQVDVRLGAARRVQGDLGPEDHPVGIRRHTVVALPAPYMFVRSAASNARETLIRALHLPYGERWVIRLPLSPDDYNAPMPLPALSPSGVALAYTQTTRGRTQPPQTRTSLVFLDVHSGLQRDSRLLSDSMGRADDLELVPLGAALLVRGREQLQVLSR